MKTASKSTICCLLSILTAITKATAHEQQQQHPNQLMFLSQSESQPQSSTKSLVRISVDSNSSQIQQLNNLLTQFSEEQVDSWRRSRQSCTSNSPAHTSADSQCIDLATTNEILDQIQQITGIHPQILLQDVDETARQQKSDRLSATKHKIFPPHRDPPPGHHPGNDDGDDDDEWHTSYHTVEEISSYLHNLASKYPNLARVEQIGLTEENRPIEALIINIKPSIPDPPNRKSNKSQNRNKRARPGGIRTGFEDEPIDSSSFHLSSGESEKKLGFVFVGELHAREWISASTLLHFAHDLLSSSSTKASNRIFDDFELTLIPLGNPDGYAYTWEEDRFWRKNRQVNRDGEEEGECRGINLGSNWGHAFQPSPITDSCSESFSGSRAFEAKETLAIRNYIDDRDKNIKGFIELHSYGQLLMYPYSFSCEEPVPDEEDLAEVSLGASRALRNVFGKIYQTGKSCEVTFPSSGSPIDYSYHSSPSKIKWSFSIELRDTGTYGFLLPPNQIKPTAMEFMAATKDLLDFVGKKEKK